MVCTISLYELDYWSSQCEAFGRELHGYDKEEAQSRQNDDFTVG